MFCENCGKDLNDGAMFCPNCGWRVSKEEAPAAEAPVEPAAVMPEEPTPVMPEEPAPAAPVEPAPAVQQPVPPVMMPVQAPVKKKKAKWPIAVIAVVVVLTAGIAAFANLDVLSNAFRKTFSSPEEYYQYIEKENLTEGIQQFAKSYGKVLDNANAFDQTQTLDVTVSIGEEGKKTLESYIPYDLSWLDSAHIKMDVNLKDYMMGMNLQTALGAQDIISMDYVADFEKNEFLMRFPELTEKYLGMKMDTGDTNFAEVIAQSQAMYDYFPKQEMLEELALSYMETVLSCLNHVDMTKEEVQAGGVAHTYTKLTVRFDEASCRQIAEKVLKKAQKDEKLKELIISIADMSISMDEEFYSYYEYTSEDVYNEFLEEVEYALEDLEYFSLDEDEKITMNVWVNNKGKIVGRDFGINSEYEKTTVGYKVVEDGKKIGYEVKADNGYEKFGVRGNGTKSGNMLTADFEAYHDNDIWVKLAAKDFDLNSLKDGYLNGTFVLSAGEEMQKEFMDYYGFSLLNRYSVSITSDMKENETNLQIGLLHDGGEMFTVDLGMTSGKGKTQEMPSESDIMYVESDYDLLVWLAGADLHPIVQNLRNAGLPSEICDAIEEQLNYLESELEWYVG